MIKRVGFQISLKCLFESICAIITLLFSIHSSTKRKIIGKIGDNIVQFLVHSVIMVTVFIVQIHAKVVVFVQYSFSLCFPSLFWLHARTRNGCLGGRCRRAAWLPVVLSVNPFGYSAIWSKVELRIECYFLAFVHLLYN